MLREQILVIDDNPINLRVASLTLELGGFEVRTAPDALSALRMIEARVPHAILVDLKMPGMDGRGFIRALQSAGRSYAVPVIAMSGYDPPSRSELVRMGFCGFIGKPITPSQLCNQVKRLIEQTVRATDAPSARHAASAIHS